MTPAPGGLYGWRLWLALFLIVFAGLGSFFCLGLLAVGGWSLGSQDDLGSWRFMWRWLVFSVPVLGLVLGALVTGRRSVQTFLLSASSALLVVLLATSALGIASIDPT
jgi:hypothetical protein